MSEELCSSKIKNVYTFAQKIAPNLPYHNFYHIRDVYFAAVKLSRLERLNYEQRFLLGTASLLHDVYYSVGDRHNEKKSVAIARQVLPKLGYSRSEISAVSDLILSTRLQSRPKNLLEQIIHDADFSSLGSYNFLEKSERLRIENKKGKEEWYCKIQPKFLRGFRYYTKSATELWRSGLRENLKKLEVYVCS